jgi:hypothetical protein
MTIPGQQKRPLSLRIKITVISLLSFLVTSACTLLRPRPTPFVTCYAMVAPTATSTPFVTCYTMPPPTETPDSTLFTSPLSPLPTPTPTATPEARRLLLGRLLAENRFPQDIAWQLSELSES